MMDIEQESVLNLKEHDFQKAKDSLKEFTNTAKKELDLTKVSTSAGLFGIFNHKVTGGELNQLTSKIQEHLIHLNKLNHSLVEEFVQVYNAFESLDKDYIAGIVAAIKAAEEVSKREQKDRRDIQVMIKSHEGAVVVLKKFKEDIDKLKHLTDVDTAWEMLVEQEKITKKYDNFMTKLTALKHIEDVDTMWRQMNTLKEELDTLQKALNAQNQKIAGLDDKLQQTTEAQTQFIDNINLLLSESREDFQKRTFAFEEEQIKKVTDVDRRLSEKIEQWTQEQTASQARIAEEQEAKWSEKEQFFTKEKETLAEEISTLTQGIRMSQLVAGGAVAVSIVQLLLLLTGVI